MACRNSCRICNRLIMSTAVAFTDGNLIITIPTGSYNNCEKYCIVVAQSIPTTTTIDAPVFIQVGTGPILYPLDNCDCTQVLARAIRTRTKYVTRVHTSVDTGTFRLLEKLCCGTDNLRSLNGEGTPATTESEV